jgi:hypothetical protein
MDDLLRHHGKMLPGSRQLPVQQTHVMEADRTGPGFPKMVGNV